MMRVREWLIAIITVVLGVSVAAESRATPLYGGYNGQSTSWVEYKIGDVETPLTGASILFGADTDDRSWVRMRISLIPLFIRLEYTRDHLGIQSAAFNTLFPWPVQLGSEIAETPGEIPLWWVNAYLVLGVGGVDSAGNSWVETGIPGVYGIGADSAGNEWLWYKVSNFLRGFGEDYTPVETEGMPGNNGIALAEKSLRPLRDLFDESVGKQLAVRFNAPSFMRAAAQCSPSLHAGTSLSLKSITPEAEMNRAFDPCTPELSELLSGAIEDELAILLENFVRTVQPLLREGPAAQ